MKWLKRVDDASFSWTQRHQTAFRVIITLMIVPNGLWQTSSIFTADHWLQAAIALLGPAILLTYAMLVRMWMRNDAIDRLAKNVLEQTDDQHLRTVAWLWARFYYGMGRHDLRELREMNTFLENRYMGRTPVDDLPAPIKRLSDVLLIERLQGPPSK